VAFKGPLERERKESKRKEEEGEKNGYKSEEKWGRR